MEESIISVSVAGESRRVGVIDGGRDSSGLADADVSSAQRPVPAGLDERGQQILDFERRWWQYAGAKEQAMRDLFGFSPTRYYQVLNALIDTAPALEYDPMLVKRLRRMRAARQRARGVRRLERL